MLEEFLLLFTPLQEQSNHALVEANTTIACLGLRRGNDIHAAASEHRLADSQLFAFEVEI